MRVSRNSAGPTETSPRQLSAVAWAGAIYAVLGGALTLLGWILNIRRLTDWCDDGISMFVNTALCAILGGAALMLLSRARTPSWRVAAGRTAAGLVALIGALTLLEHLTGQNLGIDTLLINGSWGQRAATAPMRMGPPASIAFLMLGAGLLLSTFGPRARAAASRLAMASTIVAALSLTGYWYGAAQLFGVARLTGIAFQSSTVLAALGVALMASIPEFGVALALNRQDAGGLLFRQLWAPVVAIPLVLGWLRLYGQHAGIYDLEFGSALRSLVEAIILFGLLWWMASRISRHARATDDAQRRLAAIIESSDDAIISKSLDGIIRSWNAGAERSFGYTSAEAVGQHISLIIPPERIQEEAEILARLRGGERIDHYETVRRRKDGTLRNFSLTVSPVRDAAGNIAAASKIARDITERIQAEETLRRNAKELQSLAEERTQLLEAERAARSEVERASVMKDEFLATLSHELRTPLNAILGWSQLLASKSLPPEDLQEGVAAIERNARLQTQLINDLLDMSRIISGKLRLDVQRLDLANVVDLAVQSVRPSAEAKQILLRKILDPNAGPVSGDPARLQQVIWNLLANAVKFTPKGGKVDVLLERVNSHVELTVHDSGAGIKPEFLPMVFERFRQADASTTRVHGGLGLGLSIVKTLVELHGGTIEVKSPGEGHGSSFIVSLPLQSIRNDRVREHPTAPKAPTVNGDALHLAGIKVLVVDDEPDARALIKRVLSECHAEVVTAESAAEALGLMSKTRPDVIVSDIGMPGKDGYHFMQQVRKLSAEDGGKTPAIALTAFARSEDRTRALMAGYQVHLSKPIEPQELLVTVGSVVGRMGPES